MSTRKGLWQPGQSGNPKKFERAGFMRNARRRLRPRLRKHRGRSRATPYSREGVHDLARGAPLTLNERSSSPDVRRDHVELPPSLSEDGLDRGQRGSHAEPLAFIPQLPDFSH